MRMMTMLRSLVDLEHERGADPAIFFSKFEELRDSIETQYQGLLNINPSSRENDTGTNGGSGSNGAV